MCRIPAWSLPSQTPSMKTNYLLIDYENVQPRNLARFAGMPVKVLVFHGAKQLNVPIQLANELQELGRDAKYIQISGSGRNALDFHIAFTIGELSRDDPEGNFHVLTKDKGFDPLIEFARRKGISVQRCGDVAHKPSPSSGDGMSLEEKIKAIVKHLNSLGKCRPKKRKTLSNTINSRFQNRLDSEEIEQLIAALRKRGHISLAGDKVDYRSKSVD